MTKLWFASLLLLIGQAAVSHAAAPDWLNGTWRIKMVYPEKSEVDNPGLTSITAGFDRYNKGQVFFKIENSNLVSNMYLKGQAYNELKVVETGPSEINSIDQQTYQSLNNQIITPADDLQSMLTVSATRCVITHQNLQVGRFYGNNAPCPSFHLVHKSDLLYIYNDAELFVLYKAS